MTAPNTDFSQGSVWKNIVRMSIPITLAQLINILYNIVDRMYIGHIPGAGALALTGLGLCLPVISIVMAFARLSGMGGGPLCSIERGKGDLTEAERIMGNSFTLLMIFAVALTLLGEVFLRPILMAFGASSDTIGYAMDYGRIYLAGNVFVLISLGMNNFINAQGFARTGMVTTLVGAILNIVLDPIFIFVLGWGVKGAAAATVISQAASFIISIIYLYIHRESFGFDFKPRSFAMDGKTFKALSYLGLPLTVQTSAINISMMFVSAGVNAYGLVYASVYGIGSKLTSVMFIITNSISTASATMFGQNLGAGKHDRVRQVFWFGNLYCMIFFVVVAVGCLAFPEGIFRLFTQDGDVIANAGHFMITMVVMFFGFATMTAGIALINGIGNGSLSLITALLDGVIVRIGLCVLLAGPCGMGVWGYFWGNALAGFVSVIIGDFYYLSGLWKKRKLMVG